VSFLGADGRTLHVGDKVVVDGDPGKMPLNQAWRGVRGMIHEIGPTGWCSLIVAGRGQPTKRVFHPLGLCHEGEPRLRPDPAIELLQRRLTWALRRIGELTGDPPDHIDADVEAAVPDPKGVLDR
jgi:hypothetical protein